MKRFGLIGQTLKHSFSKRYFSQKFTSYGITGCRYDNFELNDIAELPQLISNTRNLVGLNVTMPYKEQVLDFLADKDKTVEEVGACNCIKITGGKLYGFNTDAIAFERALKQHLQAHHQCALVLGTGGASKAVQYALKQIGIDFLVVSRNKDMNQLGYEDVGNDVIAQHQIIVNTTPVGMHPNVNDDPPLPYEAVTSRHLLFDLIYNPVKTKFLSHGERSGAIIVNGQEMLVQQAEESWKIWNSQT